MSRVRATNTALELRFRRALWANGLRYRVRNRLPGKPDIVFASARVVVFIDSCFWHACPWHGEQPKSNASFWSQKLMRNRLRDRQVSRTLRAEGWQVIRLWEHQLAKHFENCILRVMHAARGS